MKLTLDSEEVKAILLCHVNEVFSAEFNHIQIDSGYGTLRSMTFEVLKVEADETQ